MYDDAVSIFVKARDDLLLSICDGNDIADSVDDYLLAKSNLQAEGFEPDETWRERFCDTFVKSDFISDARRAREMAERNINFLSAQQPWRARVKTGRTHSDNVEVTPMGMLAYGEALDHPLSPLYDPSKRMNPISGLSDRSETMIMQVLPTSTNHSTHARVIDNVKHVHDREMRKNKSPHHTGFNKSFVNENGDEEMGVFFHGLGPLRGLKGTDIATTLDAYERDFARWLDGDDDWSSVKDDGSLDTDGSWRSNAIAKVKGESLSTEVPDGHFHSEEELALRKLHALDRCRSWESDHMDYDEAEKPEEPSYEDIFAEMEGNVPEVPSHGHRLGEKSWLHQLQWYSPRERTVIMEKIRDGLDYSRNQDIKLPDGTTTSAGGIKRNTQMLVHGLVDWGGRQPGFTNTNVIPMRESNEELSEYEQGKLFDSLHDIVHEGGLDSEIEDAMREALGLVHHRELTDPEQEHHPDTNPYTGNEYHLDETKGKKFKLFGGLPRLSQTVKEADGTKLKLLDSQQWQNTDLDSRISKVISSGHSNDRASKEDILLALGFDKDGSPIEGGEHPYYHNFSGPLVSEQRMLELLAQAKDKKKYTANAKDMRNDMLLYNNPLYFDSDELSEEMQEALAPLAIEGGGHYGLGAIFSALYAAGGLGRNPHTPIEMLHEHGSDEDGRSSIGIRGGDRLTIHEGNIGLWGPFIATRSDIHNTPHAIISKYNHNTIPTGAASPNSPKNQTRAGLSTLFPGLVNSTRKLTPSQIREKYGTEYYYLDTKWSSTTNNTHKQHGKGMDWSGDSDIDLQAGGEAAELGGVVSLPSEYLGRKKANIDPDSVSARQSRMHHVIGTMMGRGERGRPSRTMRINAGNLASRMSTLGARKQGLDITEGDAAKQFLLDTGALSETEKVRVLGGPLAREQGTAETQTISELKQQREGRFFDFKQDMIESQYNALLTMVGHLAESLPEGVIDKSNPNLSVDVDKLFQSAQLALMHLPPEYLEELGISVSGYGLDENEMPVRQTGFEGLPNHMQEHGFTVDRETTKNELMEYLRYPNDGPHSAHADEMLESIQSVLTDDDPSRTVMSMDHLMRTNPEISREGEDNFFADFSHHDDILDYISELRRAPTLSALSDEDIMSRYGFARNVDVDSGRTDSEGNPIMVSEKGWVKPVRDITQAMRGFKTHTKRQLGKEGLNMLGIHRIDAPTTKETGGRHVSTLTNDVVRVPGKRSNRKFRYNAARAQHDLKSVFVHDPTKELESDTTSVSTLSFGAGRRLHPKGPTGTKAIDLFDKSGLLDLSNHRRGTASFGFDFSTGKPEIGNFTQEEAFHPAHMDAINSIFGGEIAQEVQRQDDMNQQTRTANQFTSMGEATAQGAVIPSQIDGSSTWSDPSDYATFLLNPDSLLIKESSPSFTTPIRPMHRIFSFKDLKKLRGFTGSWAVCKWYDGERIVVVKKKDKVTGYDEGGSRRSIPDWARKGTKELGKKSCTLDCILAEDKMHVIDITYYDDTNVADMSYQERLKILRGQYDSYENVLVPGPHDTRLTDDDGLEELVKEMSKDHKTLLLRDGKSTYMKGETRHPKWVLLRPKKNINLIILDKRGKNRPTYRLGAGPVIDNEGIENETTEYDGKTYLDVGTVSSSKNFEEGDIVEVKVSNVSHKERGGRDVYTLTPLKIVGEGEGESSVSMETLGLLSKSMRPLHFPHDVVVNDDEVVVSIPNHDEVHYTLEKSHGGFWVHSPTTELSDLGGGQSSVDMSESLKPFWGQVVSMLLKGKIERIKKPIPSKESQDEVQEDAEVLDDENLVLKPKMERGLDLIERALDILEKNQFGFATGAQGLGIDVGSLTESPRGPTRLEGEESMPDYDMRARPTEDAERPYPNIKRHKKKKGSQSHDSDKKEHVKVE